MLSEFLSFNCIDDEIVTSSSKLKILEYRKNITKQTWLLKV